MRTLRVVDLLSFAASVVAGLVAAVAGWQGWTLTAVVSGLIAAVAPLASRLAGDRLNAAFREQLGPRVLRDPQLQSLQRSLSNGQPFQLWVAHNRHEAEPRALHAQIMGALSRAGLEPKYFGGMSNGTVGIEISGPNGSEKARLVEAFKLARIDHSQIVFTDSGQGGAFTTDLVVWIGTNPGAAKWLVR